MRKQGNFVCRIFFRKHGRLVERLQTMSVLPTLRRRYGISGFLTTVFDSVFDKKVYFVDATRNVFCGTYLSVKEVCREKESVGFVCSHG